MNEFQGLLPVRLQGDDRDRVKYVVAELLSATNVRVIVVRAFRKCNYHSQILGELHAEVFRHGPEGTFVRCLGGGNVVRDEAKKTIALSGVSHDFGPEPDRLLTARMIAGAYPGFTVSQE